MSRSKSKTICVDENAAQKAYAMIRSGMPSPDAKAMCKVVKVTVSDDKIISDLNCMNMDTEFKRHFEAVFTEIGYEATATSITLVNGQLRTATQIVKMTCVGDCD